MTEFDDLEHPDPAAEALVAGFGALLADEATWAEAPPGLADDVLAAIRAESVEIDPDPTVVPATTGHAPDEHVAPVIDLSRRRRRTSRLLAAAAAAVVVVMGVFAFSQRTSDDKGQLLALSGTDLAPDASAVVELIDTPDGTVLRLDATGLPPAADDEYYEAWLRQSPEIGVSAGTFHFRGGGGDDPIILWAAVSPADYPLVTITLQDLDGGAESSGRVVLRGRLGE